MTKYRAFSVVSLATVVLAGCGSDSPGSADPGSAGASGSETPGAAGTSGDAGAAETFSEDAESVATDSTETTELGTGRVDALLGDLADSVGAMEGDVGTGLITESTESAMNSGCTDSGSSTAELDLSELEQVIRDARQFAEDNIFREEFVESDDGTTVVYLIDPATACEEDADCVSKLTESPLRFAVNVLDDDSLSVRMLVGTDQHNPGSARLSDQALGLSVDLRELLNTVQLFMDEEERESLPNTLKGVLDLTLTQNAEQDFSLALSLVEDLELEVESEPGEIVTVNVGASQPTSEIRLNANTNALSWRQNLATVDVGVAGSLLCGEDSNCSTQEEQGTFRLHLAGVTGELDATLGSDEFVISGCGFGDETSYAALDDTQLVSMDLNPSSGRTLNIGFTDTAEGILVTFEPELDLAVATALSNLSESLRVDMPDWLFDEVFDVTLGGDPKPSILIRPPECDEFGEPIGDGQVEVAAGTLTLAATSLETPVTVEAGMCVVGVDSGKDEPHPFESVGAGVCE